MGEARSSLKRTSLWFAEIGDERINIYVKSSSCVNGKCLEYLNPLIPSLNIDFPHHPAMRVCCWNTKSPMIIQHLNKGIISPGMAMNGRLEDNK